MSERRYSSGGYVPSGPIAGDIQRGDYVIPRKTIQRMGINVNAVIQRGDDDDRRKTKVTLVADVSGYVAAMNEAAEATQRLIDLKKQLDNHEA